MKKVNQLKYLALFLIVTEFICSLLLYYQAQVIRLIVGDIEHVALSVPTAFYIEIAPWLFVLPTLSLLFFIAVYKNARNDGLHYGYVVFASVVIVFLMLVLALVAIRSLFAMSACPTMC